MSTANANLVKFPSAEKSEVALSNALLQTRLEFEADVRGQRTAFSIELWAGVAAGFPVAAEFQRAGVELRLPSASAPRLAGTAAGVAFEDLPEELAQALAETALQPLLKPLGRALGGPLTLSGMGEAMSGTDIVAWLDIRDESFGTALFVGLSDLAATMVAGHLGGRPKRDHWDGVEDLRVPIRFAFARLPVPAGRLSQIQIGDVAMLSANCDPNALTMYAGNRRVSVAQRTDDGIVVEKLLEQSMLGDGDDLENEESDGSEGVEGAEGAIDTDSLSVDVEFGFGSQSMPISELRSVSPGHVFSLDDTASGEVSITVSGAEIGRGEIVEIEGKIGVRVTSLRSKNAG